MTQPGVTDWIDVSVTVRHGMPHWPDNPPIVLERVLDLRRGDECNVSHLAMGVHTGTHMDAPVHFIPQGTGLDEMPLAATMGEARVVEIEHPREITAGELGKHGLRAGERVLFKTANSARCWQAAVSLRISCMSPSRPLRIWRRRRYGPSGSTTCPSAGTTPDGADSTASCWKRASGSSRDSTFRPSPLAGTR